MHFFFSNAPSMKFSKHGNGDPHVAHELLKSLKNNQEETGHLQVLTFWHYLN